MIGISQGISSCASVSSRVKYVCKDDAHVYTHNMYSDVDDYDGLVKEFLDNSQYLSSRSKNIMLSETLSMPPAPYIAKEDQIKILKQIVEFHLQNRQLQDHLALVAIHQDSQSVHAHILASSNPLYGSRNLRTTKKEFLKQQQALEEYRNANFKHLPSTNHYSKVLERRISLAESRMKHLRKAITKKEQIKAKLEIAMGKSTQKEFRKYLKDNNLILYKRGVKTIGVRDLVKKRNFRLNTIEKGLREKYLAFEKNIEQKRIQEQKKQQQTRENQTKKIQNKRGIKR